MVHVPLGDTPTNLDGRISRLSGDYQAAPAHAPMTRAKRWTRNELRRLMQRASGAL